LALSLARSFSRSRLFFSLSLDALCLSSPALSSEPSRPFNAVFIHEMSSTVCNDVELALSVDRARFAVGDHMTGAWSLALPLLDTLSSSNVARFVDVDALAAAISAHRRQSAPISLEARAVVLRSPRAQKVLDGLSLHLQVLGKLLLDPRRTHSAPFLTCLRAHDASNAAFLILDTPRMRLSQTQIERALAEPRGSSWPLLMFEFHSWLPCSLLPSFATPTVKLVYYAALSLYKHERLVCQVRVPFRVDVSPRYFQSWLDREINSVPILEETIATRLHCQRASEDESEPQQEIDKTKRNPSYSNLMLHLNENDAMNLISTPKAHASLTGHHSPVTRPMASPIAGSRSPSFRAFFPPSSSNGTHADSVAPAEASTEKEIIDEFVLPPRLLFTPASLAHVETFVLKNRFDSIEIKKSSTLLHRALDKKNSDRWSPEPRTPPTPDFEQQIRDDWRRTCEEIIYPTEPSEANTKPFSLPMSHFISGKYRPQSFNISDSVFNAEGVEHQMPIGRLTLKASTYRAGDVIQCSFEFPAGDRLPCLRFVARLQWQHRVEAHIKRDPASNSWLVTELAASTHHCLQMSCVNFMFQLPRDAQSNFRTPILCGHWAIAFEFVVAKPPRSQKNSGLSAWIWGSTSASVTHPNPNDRALNPSSLLTSSAKDSVSSSTAADSLSTDANSEQSLTSSTASAESSISSPNLSPPTSSPSISLSQPFQPASTRYWPLSSRLDPHLLEHNVSWTLPLEVWPTFSSPDHEDEDETTMPATRSVCCELMPLSSG